MTSNERVATLWTPLLAGAPERAATATHHARFDASTVMRPDDQTIDVVLSTLHSARDTVVDGDPAVSEHPYTVVGELGHGGMAIVYRARQDVLRRDIALKKARDPGGHKFVAEALITAQLAHPNIVPVYDLTIEQGVPALAMKLVEGKTWERALDARAPGVRDMDEHLDILDDVANAIAFAHSHGIVHCDIKPENILLGAFGEVLVVDWGIALDYREVPTAGAIAPPKSALLSPCGTPAYLAPELALADIEHIGPGTDVYLLAATLYYIATGRAPRDGMPLMESLTAAAEGEPPRFSSADDVPTALQSIITRAMARYPADRYASVAELQAALRDYRRNGESLAITELSSMMLASCRARARKVDATAERNRIYAEFADAVAGFRQALTMWDANEAARDGEHAARLAFAETALAHDDLSLAETQASLVLESTGIHRAGDGHRARAQALLAQARPLRLARERGRRVGRMLRWIIIVSLALLAGGFAVARALVVGEKEIADDNRRLAETRLDDIRRLSDVKHLSDLRAAAERLWPAVPTIVGELRGWLTNASALAARLPEHQKTLATLVHEAAPDVASQWERDTLAELVSGIEALTTEQVPAMQARLATAETLAARSIDAVRADWDTARAAIAASPLYHGLKLAPQLGLVPLGADPVSGLQEFVSLASGEVPRRGPDGKLIITEASGIVLVLLPGGTATLGARPPDADHPLGSANVDPEARAHEGPVHEVELSPFFLGKHEVTQAQWVRIEGKNPSAYLPGRTIGGRVVTALHPVEQMGQDEALAFVHKLALTLPTEAQWEYAARAGTTTPYWTGSDPRSLAGTLNIADAYCQAHEGPGSWTYEAWLDDGYTSHAPIGSYRANPFGLHDMLGNVWEWAADRIGDYTLPYEPGTGRHLVPDGTPFVFRGGGLRSNTSHARSADRYTVTGMDHRGFDIGLRAARLIQ